MDGSNVLGSMIDRCITVGFSEIIVVGGYEFEHHWPRLVGKEVIAVYNPDYTSALSYSIRAGVCASAIQSYGYAIILADLLALSPATLYHLNEEFLKTLEQDPWCILRPTYRHQFGHPVYFSAKHRPELVALDEKNTQQMLIANSRQHFHSTTVQDEGVILDADTPDDLKKFTKML